NKTPASLAAAQAATKPSSRSRVSSTLSFAVASAVSRSPAASATTDRLKRFPASAGGDPSKRPASMAPSRSSVAPASLPRTYQTLGRTGERRGKGTPPPRPPRRPEGQQREAAA